MLHLVSFFFSFLIGGIYRSYSRYSLPSCIAAAYVALFLFSYFGYAKYWFQCAISYIFAIMCAEPTVVVFSGYLDFRVALKECFSAFAPSFKIPGGMQCIFPCHFVWVVAKVCLVLLTSPLFAT